MPARHPNAGAAQSSRLNARPSSLMSCLSELDSQIATLFAVPHEILLLRHRVFREYAKIAVGTEFIHTLPSFLVIMAMLLVVWRHPPSSARLLDLLGATHLYKGFQVSVSWLMINASLWLWLILQRILYCCIWHYWSYDSEYRNMSYPWWQRVWSSYYPARVQVMSADFISWIIAMSIAGSALGCAISPDRVHTFINDILVPRLRHVLVAAKYCMEWGLRIEAQNMLDSREDLVTDDEIGSLCDDGRSEISTDANGMARGDVNPICYGTNWMPQPNFMFKEAQRNLSTNSFHAGNANDIQKPKFTKPFRHQRGCHTVPNNSSDQSSC